MDLQYRADLVLKRQRPDGPSLWARARQRIDQLLSFLGSPAHFARIATLARPERREMNIMIAPLEYLVRALLMAEAIAWLVCTEEGAALMRAAAEARDPSAPQPRATTAASMVTPAASPPPPPTNDSPAEQAPDPADAIARALDPKRLAFRLADRLTGPVETMRAPPHARAIKPLASKPPALKLNDGIRYARRLESLRLILANPEPLILIFARHLAARVFPAIDVASPYKQMPPAIATQGREIILARALSYARMLFLHQHRQRIFTRALPPPQPG